MTEADRTPSRPSGGIGRATLVIAVAAGVSKVIGFGRDAVIASVFGASADLDAYFVAQGVPNLAVGLVGSAAATALVPTLSRRLNDGDTERAHRLALGVLVAVTALVGVLCAVLAVAADQVVGLMAPGFEPGPRALAVDLTRILLVAAVFVSVMNVLAAVLQAHRRFLLANLVGIPFNLALIVAAVGFGGDHGVAALATGFVVGSLLRVGLLVPDLRRVGFYPFRRRATSDPPVAGEVRAVLLLGLPLLAASAVSNVNSIVDRIVGSGQEEGTISALTLGYRLLTIPHTLLVLSLVQAALPTLAASDPPTVDRLVRRGIATLSVVLAPTAAITIALAGPLVALIYGRGSFDGRDAVLVQQAVAGYAVGVAALGLREYINRCHIAMDATRIPLLVAGLGMAVNVVGDLTLGRSYGVAGLAASTTISFVVALAVSGALLLRYRPGLGPGTLLHPVAVTAAAAMVGGALAWVVGEALLADGPATAAPRVALAVLVAGGLGGAGYLGLLRVTAPTVLAEAVDAARSAFGRRRPGHWTG